MELALTMAKGPLFRFALAVLLIGLARQGVLILWPAFFAWRRARDRSIPWGKLLRDIGFWLVPVGHVVRGRQFTSAISYLFHFGLILVPLFLADHLSLWATATGLQIPGLPVWVGDTLTLVTSVAITLLLIYRAFHPLMRQFTVAEDYFVLVLILIPFLSGYTAGRAGNPISYEGMLLLHIVSSELLMIAVPFTKLSHCIFFPFSRLCAELGSKLASDVAYEYRTPSKEVS